MHTFRSQVARRRRSTPGQALQGRLAEQPAPVAAELLSRAPVLGGQRIGAYRLLGMIMCIGVTRLMGNISSYGDYQGVIGFEV